MLAYDIARAEDPPSPRLAGRAAGRPTAGAKDVEAAGPGWWSGRQPGRRTISGIISGLNSWKIWVSAPTPGATMPIADLYADESIAAPQRARTPDPAGFFPANQPLQGDRRKGS